MKFKIVIILVFTISLLYGQDRRKVGLIPTINESGKKYDWVSYGLEYLLYNKLSVLSGFYVIDKQKFRTALEASGFNHKTIPDSRLIYRMGKDMGAQVAVSGRYKIAANTLSLEITFSNGFNGTEILVARLVLDPDKRFRSLVRFGHVSLHTLFNCNII